MNAQKLALLGSNPVGKFEISDVRSIAELKTIDTGTTNPDFATIYPNLEDGSFARVLGYYSRADGGEGLFYFDSQSVAADNGGTIIAPTSGRGRWIRVQEGEAVNVKWFGAKGDDTNDDTAEIQAAINYALATLSGKRVYFPAGTYKISAKLTIPFSTGWIIEGESRACVSLKQYTAGASIFSLETADTHSWTVRDLTLSYNAAQVAGSAVYFDLSSGLGANGYYFWKINGVNFSNCFRCISSRTDIGQLAVWGFSVDNCTVDGSVAGALLHLSPSVAIGQPRISVSNCTVTCTSATEALINILSGDNVSLQNIEFLGGTFTNFSQLKFVTTFNVILSGIKSEGATFNNNGGTVTLWDFSQSNGTLISCSINGSAISAGTTAVAVKANEAAGTGGKLSLVGFVIAQPDSVGAGGALVAFNATYIPALIAHQIHSSITLFLSGTPNANIWSDRAQVNRSQTRGDTAVVLTATDAPFQYFNTDLTANRRVTLPNASVYDGMEFTVARIGLGAFTLEVFDPLSGFTVTIPAATKATVTVRAISAGQFVLKHYSVHP